MVCRLRLFSLFILAVILGGCAAQTAVVSNVNEREANEIVVILASKGINATKVATTSTSATATTTIAGYDIMVPANQITDALAILNQAGLPHMKGTTLLDLFGTAGLVPSDLQDKIRYQEGLSEQLANTIRKMNGIIDANVQITFPQEEGTGPAMTASVYVKHRGILDNPNSLLVTKIKRLVSSALPGLSIDNVSVIADRALISDISLQTYGKPEQMQEYVSIWSVAISKDSTGRFRMIFYSFFILLFILLCALAWILWKFFPIIQKHGGLKELYLPRQLGAGSSEEEGKEEDKEGGGGE